MRTAAAYPTSVRTTLTANLFQFLRTHKVATRAFPRHSNYSSIYLNSSSNLSHSISVQSLRFWFHVAQHLSRCADRITVFVMGRYLDLPLTCVLRVTRFLLFNWIVWHLSHHWAITYWVQKKTWINTGNTYIYPWASRVCDRLTDSLVVSFLDCHAVKFVRFMLHSAT